MDDRKLPLTRGIGWIGLVGTNAATLAFYRDGLGLTLLERDPNYDYLQAGDACFVEIYTPDARGARRIRADAPAVGFIVPDLEDAIARLRALDGSIGEVFEEWGSDEEVHRWFYAKDPEGHVVVVIERTTTAVQPRLGHVKEVAALERSIDFYCDTLGFTLTQRLHKLAFLSGSYYHHDLGLSELDAMPAAEPGEIGAHTAFRYPSCEAARTVLGRVQAVGTAVESAYDHGVSQAVYFRDPDGNGLEVYLDRPRELWPRDGEGRLAMRSVRISIEHAFRDPH